MNTIKVTPNQLKAMVKFASTDQARSAICTVAVYANSDPDMGEDAAFLVATDSYVIGAFAPRPYDTASDFAAALAYAKCIGSIPVGSITDIIKLAGTKGSVELTWADDSWCFAVTSPTTVTDIDGQWFGGGEFPNVRSIFPARLQDVRPTPFTISPVKMAKVLDASLLMCDQVAVSRRGTSVDRSHDGKEPLTYVGAVHLDKETAPSGPHFRPQWFFMNDARVDVHQCSMLTGIMTVRLAAGRVLGWIDDADPARHGQTVAAAQ